ncbi:MAG: LEA type 2 family protein [Daejeonella sp.]
MKTISAYTSINGNKLMKTFFLLCFTAMLLFSCGINNQARQIKALEKCIYEIKSADSIYVAGQDVSTMIKDKTISMDKMPGLAFAYLSKNIPFKARLNLHIENPSGNLAGINQFEYKILLKNEELANGFINQVVSIEPGGTTTIPVNIQANIYRFLSNGKTMQEILDFVKGGNDTGTEKKGILTLKIKPTIALGNKRVNYPGYITIDKEVSSKILF